MLENIFTKQLKFTKKILAITLTFSILFTNFLPLLDLSEGKAYAEAGESVTTNLVNWYKFNENSGVTAGDEVAPAANGTLTNGAAWSTDVPPNTSPNGASIFLDGVNDYVSVSSPGLPTADFTYAA